jgi:hypothetical protein
MLKNALIQKRIARTIISQEPQNPTCSAYETDLSSDIDTRKLSNNRKIDRQSERNISRFRDKKDLKTSQDNFPIGCDNIEDST